MSRFPIRNTAPDHLKKNRPDAFSGRFFFFSKPPKNDQIANIDTTFVIKEASLSAFQNAILAVAQTLTIGHVAVGSAFANYSDSPTGGSASAAIIVRHGNSSYKIALLNECVSGYYYNDSWHWTKATMSSYTPN